MDIPTRQETARLYMACATSHVKLVYSQETQPAVKTIMSDVS